MCLPHLQKATMHTMKWLLQPHLGVVYQEHNIFLWLRTVHGLPTHEIDPRSLHNLPTYPQMYPRGYICG